MTILTLTAPEIHENVASLELLKNCPELSHEVTINLQRTFKKHQAILEEVEDARKALLEKIRAKFRKEQGKEKDEDVVLSIKDQEEFNKAIVDFNKNQKFEVQVHLLKKSAFPTSPKDFGQRETVLASKEGGPIIQKRNYYEGFLALLDTIILEDAAFNIKTKETISKK